ncbi:hypothetical protein GJU39_19825 [Pedobacter petrophilus]|uniref:Glycosyltransferase n=1 Tax=Pedobacter petrophilus TaxID=1908241 RepID=A0A7K0G5Q9_9SPHI|nr:hypothetical protein [Pedobacter petrophilus]MRX78336.1 hypothetical protein [Pedobacter petrophilus]
MKISVNSSSKKDYQLQLNRENYMLNDRDKQRQKRHRKRLEARIDASAIVVAISDYCLNPELFSLVYSMLGELPDHIKSKIHLYGIDSGGAADKFTALKVKSFTDYGVPLYYVGMNDRHDLSIHYNAIDVLIVSEDNEPGLSAVKSALAVGCSVIAKSEIADKINLNIKERLRVIDKQCASELSNHIMAFAAQRRKFDCALAS